MKVEFEIFKKFQQASIEHAVTLAKTYWDNERQQLEELSQSAPGPETAKAIASSAMLQVIEPLAVESFADEPVVAKAARAAPSAA